MNATNGCVHSSASLDTTHDPCTLTELRNIWSLGNRRCQLLKGSTHDNARYPFLHVDDGLLLYNIDFVSDGFVLLIAAKSCQSP